MRDTINNTVSTFIGNLPLTGTTPKASEWVDMQGFDSCTIEMVNGIITDAGTVAGFTATMQHGDDVTNAGAVDVVAADTVNGIATITVTDDTADDAIAGAIGYRGSKRYVRLNIVGTTGTDAAVVVVSKQHKAAQAPTTYIGTALAGV